MLNFDLTDEFPVKKKFLLYQMLVTKTAKIATKMSKLSPTHLVSNISHQHLCGRLLIESRDGRTQNTCSRTSNVLFCSAENRTEQNMGKMLTHWPELWVTRNYSVTIVVCMVLLKTTGCLHVPVVTNKYTWVTFDCLFSSLWSQMNPESESVPSAKL